MADGPLPAARGDGDADGDSDSGDHAADHDVDPAVPSGNASGTAGHDPTGLGLAKTIAGAVRGARRAAHARSARSDARPVVDQRLAGARPDDRDPQPLGSAMDRFVDDHGWSTDISLRILLGKWASLVGGANAAHSTPTGYRDNVLVVQAESTVWATSLRSIAPQLVAKLNAELGDGTVTRVDVRGPQVPSWKKGRRSVRDGRGPRDTYG